MDDNKIKNKFAKFLKEKRTALGLSLRAFSVLIYGIEGNFAYLSKIENGTKQVNSNTMNLILNKLNCEFEIEEN